MSGSSTSTLSQRDSLHIPGFNASHELQGGLPGCGVVSPKLFSDGLKQQEHNGKGCYWVQEKLVHRGELARHA